MKKSELKQIIKEELVKILNERTIEVSNDDLKKIKKLYDQYIKKGSEYADDMIANSCQNLTNAQLANAYKILGVINKMKDTYSVKAAVKSGKIIIKEELVKILNEDKPLVKLTIEGPFTLSRTDGNTLINMLKDTDKAYPNIEAKLEGDNILFLKAYVDGTRGKFKNISLIDGIPISGTMHIIEQVDNKIMVDIDILSKGIKNIHFLAK